MTKDARQGLKPKNRKLATTTKGKKLTANQWTNTPQQNKFMELWCNPSSETFGNAYQSGIAAGYTPYYAAQLAAPSINTKWITEYKNRLFYSDEHIRQGIQGIAKQANNSRSPDDTRLKAYEILAKVSGMLDNANTTTVNIVQPILAGQSTNPTTTNIVEGELATPAPTPPIEED